MVLPDIARTPPFKTALPKLHSPRQVRVMAQDRVRARCRPNYRTNTASSLSFSKSVNHVQKQHSERI